jgi:endo-alpha-1,4-polygalactosaminidase (GH114 family)
MKKHYFILLVFNVLLFFSSCVSSEDSTIYKANPLAPNDSFDWRLDNVNANTPIDAKVIDVDAFETRKEDIDAWHKKGMYVIAYVSVGSQDDTRIDASDFPAQVIGDAYPGYEDEAFIDIRQIEVLAPIIKKRFDMIQAKGFDGIEPDNIDLYVWDSNQENKTGFGITVEDSKKYMDFLIDQAHKRGLSIGQKNANELSSLYVDKFDWALSESAFEGNITQDLKVYPLHNKPVFSVEYTDKMDEATFLSQVCPKAKSLNFTAILKDRKLDAYIRTCP